MAISDRLNTLLLSALGLPDIRDELAGFLNDLASLASGKILIGNSSNVAAAVTPSGDVTISNAGVTAIGANKVLNAMLDKSLIQSTTVTIPTASVLTLNSTPFTLIAAPGAGLVIVPVALYSTMTYNSATYAANAAGFSVRYTDGSGASTAMTLTQAYIQSAASAIFNINAGTTAITPVANAPLVLYADTANPTTGNSDLKIRIWYRIVANPAF